jgi:ATP-binding cassette subfamily B (MDR/TAP) protein 1
MGNSAMTVVAPAIPDLIKAAASAQHIFRLLEPDSPTNADSVTTAETGSQTISGQLRFENVSFAYPFRPSVIVLNDLSVDISPGQVTAVVGHSGSGKSTLITLLERWYEPLSGEIYLDGISIKYLGLKWWRRQIGLVQQVNPKQP